MKRKFKKTAAFVCAFMFSFGAVCVPCSLNEQAYTVSAASSAKLAAPTDIKTSMSNGTLNVSWKKVKGASAYRVDVRYPWSPDFTELKTVYQTNVNIPYLKNGDKVAVRITPLKKVESGYSKGRSVTISKVYKGELICLTDDNIFLVDPSLIGIKFSALEKKTGTKLHIEECPYFGDDAVYWGWPTEEYGNGWSFAYTLDKNKNVLSIYSDLPLDSFNSDTKNALDKIYGTAYDLKAESPEEYKRWDFWYLYVVKQGVQYEIWPEYYGDGSSIYLRQRYYRV